MNLLRNTLLASTALGLSFAAVGDVEARSKNGLEGFSIGARAGYGFGMDKIDGKYQNQLDDSAANTHVVTLSNIGSFKTDGSAGALGGNASSSQKMNEHKADGGARGSIAVSYDHLAGNVLWGAYLGVGAADLKTNLDGTFKSVKSTAANGDIDVVTKLSYKTSLSGDFLLRAGYQAAEGLAPYVTAGVAYTYGEVEREASTTENTAFSGGDDIIGENWAVGNAAKVEKGTVKKHRVGPAVGAGVHYALGSNARLTFEYLYRHLGSWDPTADSKDGANKEILKVNTPKDSHAVTLGISYVF